MRIRGMHAIAAAAVVGAFLSGAAVGVVRGQQGRQIVNLPDRTTQAPFSDAVLVGDTLYLSGRLGVGPAGSPPVSVETEVRNILDGLKATLAEADMTMDDLVSVQVFCSDVALYDQFNAVYRTYFSDGFPARAFLGSGTLLRDARFEVQGIAARR